MTEKIYGQLPNRLARAQYLIAQPFIIHTETVEGAPLYRVKAGDHFLPVNGRSETATLAKAKAWLQTIIDEETALLDPKELD